MFFYFILIVLGFFLMGRGRGWFRDPPTLTGSMFEVFTEGFLFNFNLEEKVFLPFSCIILTLCFLWFLYKTNTSASYLKQPKHLC